MCAGLELFVTRIYEKALAEISMLLLCWWNMCGLLSRLQERIFHLRVTRLYTEKDEWAL